MYTRLAAIRSRSGFVSYMILGYNVDKFDPPTVLGSFPDGILKILIPLYLPDEGQPYMEQLLPGMTK